jgi:cytochrome c biogenesis protein CcmG/thiol:disulfide interchange protein DsbE
MTKTSAVALSLVLVAAAACSGADPRVEGGVAEVSTPLPELTQVPTLSGEALPPATLAGPASVINVWATWCEPCRREQPALLAVQERYADRGVGFLGINYNDDREQAERWIEEYDVTYPSLYDPDGRTASMLGFPFLPDTYVVDGSGTIRFVIYGETDEAELSGLIDRVLASDGEAEGVSSSPGEAT